MLQQYFSPILPTALQRGCCVLIYIADSQSRSSSGWDVLSLQLQPCPSSSRAGRASFGVFGSGRVCWQGWLLSLCK